MRTWQMISVMAATAVATLAFFLIAAETSGDKPQAAVEETLLSGQLIDLTCATKSYATTGKWGNAANTHKLPGTGGELAERCAKMCLRGGQPAGLFDGENVMAIFICNPKPTLSNYAAEQVEVRGHWTHHEAKTFYPEQIRRPGSEWAGVDCESRL